MRSVLYIHFAAFPLHLLCCPFTLPFGAFCFSFSSPSPTESSLLGSIPLSSAPPYTSPSVILCSFIQLSSLVTLGVYKHASSSHHQIPGCCIPHGFMGAQGHPFKTCPLFVCCLMLDLALAFPMFFGGFTTASAMSP